MWKVDISPDIPVVYSIFGVQYHGDTPSASAKALIATFDKIIVGSAKYVDSLEQDGPLPAEGKTKIWVGYWQSYEAYHKWWTQETTSEFWNGLGDDAGMWREVLTVPHRRTLFFANTDENVQGLGTVGQLSPLTEKMGYWGCYRDRFEETTDTNRLDSSISSMPKRTPLSKSIRSGRVKMTQFPDNLTFTVETQDHSHISEEEREFWAKNLDKSASHWIGDVVTAESEGLIIGRTCYAPESGQFCDKPEMPALSYNTKLQMVYYLDHAHLERIGRSNKWHTALVSKFFKSYLPDGPMSKIARILLRVESSILKANEMEAEYIGCFDGTGFMAYDKSGVFQSHTMTKATRATG